MRRSGTRAAWAFALGALAGSCETTTGAPSGAPPNVLLILADDLGWKDLACYGNERTRTPHLDALARSGMRFTDAYSAAPICSPARASLLTGMAPGRLHVTNHIPEHPSYAPEGARYAAAPVVEWIEPEATTLAEHLKARGYATGLFGKWHLMGPWDDVGWGDARHEPRKNGFDVNVGGCAWGGRRPSSIRTAS